MCLSKRCVLFVLTPGAEEGDEANGCGELGVDEFGVALVEEGTLDWSRRNSARA